MKAKFPLGLLLSTPAALRAAEASGDDLSLFLARHARGDWGAVSEGDRRLNDQAIINGDRLLSSYLLRDGSKVWIITEGDRSATTVLLPDEY